MGICFNVRRFKLSALLLLIAVAMLPGLVIAEKVTSEPPTALSYQQLVESATKHNINIVNFSPVISGDKITVQKSTLINKSKLRKFILHRFENTAVSTVDDKEIIYILPVGVDASRLKDVKSSSAQHKKLDYFATFAKAKELKHKDIFSSPEVKAIINLANNEESKNLHFERFIDPDDLSSVYSFDVAYDARLKTMVPYQKNGKTVSFEMEGYSSFYSIKSFLDKKSAHLRAFRYKKDLFIKVKGAENALMVIRGDEKRMTVATKVRTINGPQMDMYLEGDQHQIKVTSIILHPDQKIVLADVVRVK